MRYTQTKGIKLPEYRIIKQEGPPHQRVFTIQVHLVIDGKVHPCGIGKGTSKKDAEQKSALNTLNQIDSSDLGDLAKRDLM